MPLPTATPARRLWARDVAAGWLVAQGIDESVLHILTVDDLKETDAINLGDREKLLSAIAVGTWTT